MSESKYTVIETKEFKRRFEKLPPEVQQRIKNKIQNELIHEPYSYEPYHGKYKGARKLRVGDYRVLFIVDEKKKAVVLFYVMHRGEEYRK